MKILSLSIFIYFLFCTSCTTDAKDNLLNETLIRKDTLYGYFNNDTLRDYMFKQFFTDKILIDIYLKNQNGFQKSISRTFTSSIFSDEDFFQNADLFNDVKGGISLVGFCCGNWKTVENYYYEYNDQVQNWILNKKYTYSYNQDYSVNYEVDFPTKAISINELKFDQIETRTESERHIYYNNLLLDLSMKFSKSRGNYLSQYPKFVILDMLDVIPVTSNNVVQYNDLAFYLQQSASSDRDAQYILQEIIKKYPNRMVAYINLGDVYWDLEEYDSAKESYGIYVRLMKEAGKDNVIPKIILKRLLE